MIFYDCKTNPPKYGLRYLVKMKTGEVRTAEYWVSTKTWKSSIQEPWQVLEPEYWAIFPHPEIFIVKDYGDIAKDLNEMLIFSVEKIGFGWSMFILFFLLGICSIIL